MTLYISDISGNNTGNDTELFATQTVETSAEERAVDQRPWIPEPRIAPARDAAAIEPAEYSRSTLKIARNYAIVTLICLIVGIVYEIFSHGVWSVFMIGAFAVPLVLGVIPNLLIGFGNLKTPAMPAETLYACGVATLTIGSLLKGALDIFGTTNTLLDYYWMVGGAFALLGIIFYLAQKK